MEKSIPAAVRVAASRLILFLPHSIHQMSRPDRMITAGEVERVVRSGELVEDYPEDARGHSRLLSGVGEGDRPVHVVCAPREEYLAVITAYLPDARLWSDDFKRRL